MLNKQKYMYIIYKKINKYNLVIYVIRFHDINALTLFCIS